MHCRYRARTSLPLLVLGSNACAGVRPVCRRRRPFEPFHRSAPVPPASARWPIGLATGCARLGRVSARTLSRLLARRGQEAADPCSSCPAAAAGPLRSGRTARPGSEIDLQRSAADWPRPSRGRHCRRSRSTALRRAPAQRTRRPSQHGADVCPQTGFSRHPEGITSGRARCSGRPPPRVSGCTHALESRRTRRLED